MAEDPVTEIYGIGPSTANALRRHQVTNVGQLAALSEGELSIPNLNKLIHRAQEYLAARKPAVAAPSETKAVVLNGTLGTTAKPKTLFPLPDKTERETPVAEPEATTTPVEAAPQPPPAAEEMFWIADHSWFESRVLVPGEAGLREAVVYELSVEPSERVSLLCCWVDTSTTTGEEEMRSMSYSPQLLFHFNLTLPPLQVSMREEDLDALPNRHTLENVLWEVEMMRRSAGTE